MLKDFLDPSNIPEVIPAIYDLDSKNVIFLETKKD
jgi:hypothetical protein